MSTRQPGPSEIQASRLIGAIKTLLSPPLPSETLIEQARQRFIQKHPGTPVNWAINYAVGRAQGVADSIGGPLWFRDLVIQVGLENELRRAETYLVNTSKFLDVGSPGSIDTDASRSYDNSVSSELEDKLAIDPDQEVS